MRQMGDTIGSEIATGLGECSGVTATGLYTLYSKDEVAPKCMEPLTSTRW